MDILLKAIELDMAYLDTFTNRMDTSWGYLFYNENQPSYYDANHAQLSIEPLDPKAVIDEVIRFYREKNLIPRIYLYNYDNLANFINELVVHSFKVEDFISPVQLWNKKISEREKNSMITIEKVTEENFHDALHVECSIKEFGGKEVREKAFPEEFKHPAYTHYLLRYNGTACSTACIFANGNQARMESVATLEEYRGRGLIGELIHHIQQEVLHKGFEHLWIFPINERVERVYQKNGFDTIGKIKTGHAYLGGKGIKEIRD